MTGYSELTFQQAWNGASFRLTGLVSDTGQRVDIVDPGKWNHLGGPDFQEARVSVDGLLFTGCIELHRDPAEWYSHGHHRDPAYNQVVLHVSPSRARRPVVRQDGTIVPHVNIGGIMPGWLPQAVKIQPRLACEKVLDRNLDALKSQLELASAQYFEELCSRLLGNVRMGKPFQSELVRSMIIRTGSVLGAPANRDIMAEAASILWDNPEGADSLTAMAVMTSHLHWRNQYGRPATMPSRRLNQLYRIVDHVRNSDFERYWSSPSELVLKLMLGDLASSHTAGVVRGTIIIPAQWLMSTVSGDHGKAATVRNKWDQVLLPASPEASRAFGHVAGQIDRKHYKGLTWQYGNQCKVRSCASCRVGNRMVS